MKLRRTTCIAGLCGALIVGGLIVWSIRSIWLYRNSLRNRGGAQSYASGVDWYSYNLSLEPDTSPTGERYSSEAPHAGLVSDVTPLEPTRPPPPPPPPPPPEPVAPPIVRTPPQPRPEHERMRPTPRRPQVLERRSPFTAAQIAEWESATVETLPARCDNFFPLRIRTGAERTAPASAHTYLTTPYYFPGFNSVRLQLEQHSYLCYLRRWSHVTNWVVPDNHNSDKGGGLLSASGGLFSIWTYFDRDLAESVQRIVDSVQDLTKPNSGGDRKLTAAMLDLPPDTTLASVSSPLSFNGYVVSNDGVLPPDGSAAERALAGYVQKKAIVYNERHTPPPPAPPIGDGAATAPPAAPTAPARAYTHVMSPELVPNSHTRVVELTRVLGENNFYWPSIDGAIEYNCFVLRTIRPAKRLTAIADAIIARLRAESGSGSVYHSFQMRRTDYGDPQSTTAMVDHIRRLQLFPDDSILYIATDSRKADDLAPFRKFFRVRTLSEYKDTITAAVAAATGDTALVNDHLMLIEQLICSRGEWFIGTQRSSVTEGVLKYRTVVPYSGELPNSGGWHVFDLSDYFKYRSGSRNVMSQFLPHIQSK